MPNGMQWEEEYGAVTAQDFVTGSNTHDLRLNQSLFLIQNSIKGLDAYVKGKPKTLTPIRVKALDDHTINIL